MRQGQQNRRGRGRGSNNSNASNSSNLNNGRKPQNSLSRNYESSGPDVKIRGSAAQIAEKYMALARDATSSGDPVMTENYLQHAEHYNRIIMAAQAQVAPQPYQPQPDTEHGQGVNGYHRPQPAMRTQPQPLAEVPLAMIPPGMEPQPAIAGGGLDSGNVPQAVAPQESDGVRRRRRRYPAGGSRAADVGEQPGPHGGADSGADSGNPRPTDEILAS